MKLNNHVHNRLKKRYLKKFQGRSVCKVRGSMQPSYKYYQLIKLLECHPLVDDNVAQALKRRLRIRGTMPSRDREDGLYIGEDFTGDLTYDFLWSGTEEGLEYWKRMDDWLSKHYPQFYSN